MVTIPFDEHIKAAYLRNRPRRPDGRLAKENDRQAFARGYQAGRETTIAETEDARRHAYAEGQADARNEAVTTYEKAYNDGYRCGVLRGSQDPYANLKVVMAMVGALALFITAIAVCTGARELVKLNDKDLAPKAPTVVNEVKMPEPKVVVVQQQVPSITLRMDKQLLRARNTAPTPGKAVVK